MDQNVWKQKHPGVPTSWQAIGEGGNAYVWRAEEGAVKRLKAGSSEEARKRFSRECEIMERFRGRGDLRIVPVSTVRWRENAAEIVMDAMTGNLEKVVGRFKCAPLKSATALLPIVKTLAVLASETPRVHHRDIKPTNLLYLDNEDELYLADFGCAFLGEGERVTPDHRALGAWAYRPPEYSGGRVETVDEKGDVFSLGKLLWAMINGEPGTTFPGPVWYLPEYDLASICSDDDGVGRAMYIIGKCCSVRPGARPTLSELADMLRALIERRPSEAMSLGPRALAREQQEEIEFDQRRAIARPFVTTITADFSSALIALAEGTPDSLTFQAWLAEWQRTGDRTASLVAQVAERESDAPVLNVHRRQKMLFTRFYPDSQGGLRFFAAFGPMHAEHRSPRLTVRALDGGMIMTVEGLTTDAEVSQYTSSTLVAFLARAVDAWSHAAVIVAPE